MTIDEYEYKHVYRPGIATVLSENTCEALFQEIDFDISRYEFEYLTQGSITDRKFIWVFLGRPLYATIKIKSQTIKSSDFQLIMQLIIHVTTKDSNNKCVFLLTKVTTTQLFHQHSNTVNYFGQSNLNSRQLLYWKVGAKHD